MPVYEYVCDRCGTRTEDYVLSWEERRDAVECPCGKGLASHVPSTFTVDFSSPGYKALLREKGEIPVEPGLDRDIARNREHQKQKRKKQVADAVKKSVTEAFTVTVNS